MLVLFLLHDAFQFGMKSLQKFPMSEYRLCFRFRKSDEDIFEWITKEIKSNKPVVSVQNVPIFDGSTSSSLQNSVMSIRLVGKFS
jgi:hypothetical protein